MIKSSDFNLDSKTISKIGLRLSDKHFNDQITPETRVFEYPHLDNVFILESDLYGNVMPKNSCFLAFNGSHGFIGEQMSISNLLDASVEEIQNIVTNNNEGWSKRKFTIYQDE